MKKPLLSACAATMLALGCVASAHAQVIFYDGFESPMESGINYGGTDSEGAQFGNGTGIQQNGSPFGYAAAPQGVQTAHIQGTGSFTETVSGLVTGQTYTLSFYDAQRSGYGVDSIDVSYQPLLEPEPDIGSMTPTSTNFTLYSKNFVYEGYGSPTAVFTIAGLDPQTVGPNGSPMGDFNAAVDGFQIATASAVPEPATWALMLIGVGGIGLAFRQAKRNHGFRFKDAFAA